MSEQDNGFEEPTKRPRRPTKKPAGPERVQVYRRRFERGETLFHEEDVGISPQKATSHAPAVDTPRVEIQDIMADLRQRTRERRD